MYRLQIRQLVVVGVYACAEKQASVPPVDDLTAAPKLDEVGLVFLISRRDEPVDLAFKLDLLVIVVRVVPFC